MKDVVTLDVSRAASGFLLSLSRPLKQTGSLPCPKLTVLTVRGGQWGNIRLVVEARFRAGCPLDTVRYEAHDEDTEGTIERFFLDDLFYVRTHVKSLQWVSTASRSEISI